MYYSTGLIQPLLLLPKFYLLMAGEISKSWTYKKRMYLSFEAIGKQFPVDNYPSPIEGSLNANMCL